MRRPCHEGGSVYAARGQFRLQLCSVEEKTRCSRLTVDVHLSLALVVLDVTLGLLGLVTSDGTDNSVLLALETVTEAATCQHFDSFCFLLQVLQS